MIVFDINVIESVLLFSVRLRAKLGHEFVMIPVTALRPGVAGLLVWIFFFGQTGNLNRYLKYT